MALLLNLAGQTFGRLTVLEKTRGPHPNKTYWLCRCECGNERVVDAQKIRLGTTQSCGCLHRDSMKSRFTTHGWRRNRTIPLEYRAWINMTQRCSNPNHPSFKNYGARGISVCERWDKFENFLADMGTPPSGLTLDRIDNDGDYTPENCRWATHVVQTRNKRSNRFVEFAGKRLVVADAAAKYGLQAQTVYQRIRRGWPEDRWFLPKLR